MPCSFRPWRFLLQSLLGGIIIASVRGNPFLAYYGLIQGSFGSAKALSETAVWATPYIFAGLAVALAFKGGLFNIGAEGQLASEQCSALNWICLAPVAWQRYSYDYSFTVGNTGRYVNGCIMGGYCRFSQGLYRGA